MGFGSGATKPSWVFEVYGMVDDKTSSRLSRALGIAEMNKILDSPTVLWSSRAPCMRHAGGNSTCEIPVAADLDSWQHGANAVASRNTLNGYKHTGHYCTYPKA